MTDHANSGSLAMLAAMRRASSRVSNFAAIIGMRFDAVPHRGRRWKSPEAGDVCLDQLLESLLRFAFLIVVGLITKFQFFGQAK